MSDWAKTVILNVCTTTIWLLLLFNSFSVKVQRKPLIVKAGLDELNDAQLALRSMDASMKKNVQSEVRGEETRFYQCLPHAPKVHFQTHEQVHDMMRLVDDVRCVLLARAVLKVDNPISIAKSLHDIMSRNIEHLSTNSEHFKLCDEFLKSCQGMSSHHKPIRMLNAYQVRPNRSISDYNNKMLLWHGTSRASVAYILASELKCASLTASGYNGKGMFGDGIYFTDCSTKAAYHSLKAASANETEGYLLLCQVALGQVEECSAATQAALPSNRQSRKGVGSYAPAKMKAFGNDHIPQGPIVDTGVKSNLRYNEYIVYNEQQVSIRYVVHFTRQ